VIVRLDGSGKSVNATARRRAFIGNAGAARKKMGDYLPGSERIERAARSGFLDTLRCNGTSGAFTASARASRAAVPILEWMGEIKNLAILRSGSSRPKLVALLLS